MYYDLKKGKFEIDQASKVLFQEALKLRPKNSKEPIIVCFDDSITPKFGKSFESVALLHDHAKHNGKEYTNGHCFVCAIILMPIMKNGKKKYIRIPFQVIMWKPEDEQASNGKTATKLELATRILSELRKELDDDIELLAQCDAWYSKGPVIQLVKDHKNVQMNAAVRVDTVLYELPSDKTGQRGRPPLKGEKIVNFSTFEFHDVPKSNLKIASKKVKTRLFGLDRVVLAIVTMTADGSSKRLFLCTDLNLMEKFGTSFIDDAETRGLVKKHPDLLAYYIYLLRWNIEILFYELKTFWNFGDYKVLSATAIERLLNTICVTYAVMTLLPHLSEGWAYMSDMSIQERRDEVKRVLNREIILGQFLAEMRKDPKLQGSAKDCEEFARKRSFISTHVS